MLQKIIAIGIGLIMAIATITGCGFIEDKISETEEEEKEKSYICTIYETYSEGEYESKFAFTNTGDDDNQFRKDVSDIQYYYLDNGYRVSSIMYTDDWSQAFMWVYSSESLTDVDVVYK